jgi:hypothetical protein
LVIDLGPLSRNVRDGYAMIRFSGRQSCPL